MFKKIILVGFVLVLVGCSSSKSKITSTKSENSSSDKALATANQKAHSNSKAVITSDLINGYIFHYKDIAMNNMKNFGIPASIILAQGILESGSGQSHLALTANNHFGIKCYTDWKGETAYQDDDAAQECFRKYRNPQESFQDHADILSKRKRYASLFNLEKGDYRAWARGLKAAGYATDPNYPEKLINYIERYQLNQYDNMVLGKEYVLNPSQNVVSKTKPIKNSPQAGQYVVQQGDTLYSISKRFNIPIEDLKKQNNMSDNAISIGQNLKIQ
jgi:flagellum-specific peptidoglycan hydrolase FlgJ